MSELVQITLDTLLSERATGMGSSDIHHIYSLPPYGCRNLAWRLKRKLQPDYPWHGNPSTRRGTRLEEIAAEEYEERFGRKLQIAPTVRDKEFEYLLCHADRIIEPVRRGGMGGQLVTDSDTSGIAEIKVPGREMFKKIVDGGLPDAYKLQLQWSMGLHGASWGEFIIFWADGWELKVYPVQADAHLFAEMRADAIAFWAQVENGPEPEKLDPKDPRCGRCMFRRQCQGAKMLELAQTEVPDKLPYEAKYAEYVAELWEREEIAKQANDLVDESKEKIKALLGDVQAIETNGARLYFKPQQRETLQKDPLLKELRKLARDAQELINNGCGNDVPVLTKIAKLPELIAEKYTNKSIARPLRIFPS